MGSKRITILDGFRVIAILFVLLFHFYTRFQNDKYHYTFGFSDIFSFGNLGVEFFFIISGFVITLTLNKCSNFFEFIKKRFLRLMPAMLVCSVLTFLILNVFDKGLLFPESHKTSNLLISNTFVSPKLANFFSGWDLHYIDGAYWSLWVEITFYVVVSILYFVDKRNLLRNYSLLTILGYFLHYTFITSVGKVFMTKIISESSYEYIRELINIFDFLTFSGWFLLGIILYHLHALKSKKILVLFTVVFLLQTILMGIRTETVLFMFFIYSLLILFIYRPEVIAFLGNKYFSRLGLVSYSVYLIHQNIGVLIINKLSPYFGTYNWIIAIFLIFFAFTFGLLSYRYLEKPISARLKKIIFR